MEELTLTAQYFCSLLFSKLFRMIINIFCCHGGLFTSFEWLILDINSGVDMDHFKQKNQVQSFQLPYINNSSIASIVK